MMLDDTIKSTSRVDENDNETMITTMKLDRTKLFLQLNETTTTNSLQQQQSSMHIVNDIIKCQPARSTTTTISKSRSMHLPTTMKMSRLSLMSTMSNANSDDGTRRSNKLFHYFRSKRRPIPPPPHSIVLHSPLPCLRRLWHIDNAK